MPDVEPCGRFGRGASDVGRATLRWLILAGVLACGLSGIAHADLPKPDRPTLPLHHTRARPSFRPCAAEPGALAQAPPSVAPRPPGKVVLNCEIAASGQLRDCRVVSEDPPDQGYAGDALRVACAMTVRGAPDRAGPLRRLTLPITFRVKD